MITYIITSKQPVNVETTKETWDSIIKIAGTDAKIIDANYSECTEEEAINIAIEKVETDQIVIIPDGSTLSENYLNILSQYVKDDKAIYLPIGSYYYDPENDNQFKGFLNTILWKPQVTDEVGKLTARVALKQIDHTLYGALIPTSILKENKFNKDIKYFSQFEFVNRILKAGVNIIGVPKMLFNLYKDYELKKENKEEKIKYFEEARKGYMPDIQLPAELLRK